jgi:cell division septation protein DedD
MTKNRDDHSENNDEPTPAAGAKPGMRQRHEPTFANFNPDEDDDYEEPDRDTDYASGYPADELEDDEYDYADDDEEPYVGEDFDEDEPALTANEASENDSWDDKERFFVEEDEDTSRTWPLGLIAVAVIAIALLAAGGYGVVQQRTATENELRELRARLATTGTTGETSASSEALRKMKQSYEQLAQEAQALELENARLTDTVAGLEAQLEAQQAVLADSPSTTSSGQPVAAPAPAASVTKQPVPQSGNTASSSAPNTNAVTPKPADAEPPSPAATNSTGPWFVNFGSYAGRTMAETWASRLKPAAGNVIISPNNIDGKTLFRVRVIGLPDRAAAQQVARQLETDQRVSALWVGKD